MPFRRASKLEGRFADAVGVSEGVGVCEGVGDTVGVGESVIVGDGAGVKKLQP